MSCILAITFCVVMHNRCLSALPLGYHDISIHIFRDTIIGDHETLLSQQHCCDVEYMTVDKVHDFHVLPILHLLIYCASTTITRTLCSKSYFHKHICPDWHMCATIEYDIE